MTRSLIAILLATIVCLISGCSPRQLPPQPEPRPMHREPAAQAFSINGDYASHVMLTLGADGSSVVWRPEVNTVDSLSAPVALADGFYLAPGEVTANTVFLTWTYADYSRLAATPTDAEILSHVVPGSGVTAIVELPIGRYALQRHPEAARDLIANKEYRILYQR